jgi:phosphonate transport system substrate-binding protein
MVQPAGAPLGTEQNPVKLALAPTTDASKALAAIEPLTRLLAAETGLRFKLSVPTSHPAVIEAMGTTNVDIAWVGPLGYLAARERVGAEPLLAGVRNGSMASVSRIMVRADGGAIIGERVPPELADQITVIGQMVSIPNDTLCVRKGIPPALARKLADGLLRVAASPAGAQVLRDLYAIDGLAPIADNAFEPVRAAVGLLDLDLDAAIAPARARATP